MRRVKHRAVSVLVIAAALAAGLGLYLVKFAVSGGAWASSKVNAAVYSSGALALGAVTDRNGVVLAEARDGVRIFAEDKTLRKATLHAVGDVAGNIGTGALKTQIPALVGYNPVFGTYSLSGSGGTVRLSIDSELNLAAYSALDGRHGAVVVIDCATGELLCSVSSPAFDPNNPSEVDPDSPKYDGVYLNRALSSAFTPGSVFKLVTAAAALENIPDIEERVFHCDGKLAVGADAVTCPSKHGDIGFEDALAHSCNVAFAQLALELGGDTLAKYAADYGLTQRLPIGNVLTAAGKFEVGADGSIDLAWSGAGQYNDLASPIAMARLCAAIANGGVAPELTATAKSGLFGNAKTQRVMAAETADALREMMGYNVTSYYGADSFPGLELFAKSGTAEVGSSREPHAWFVGFIENGARPLAFAVVVENGGSGRLAAGGVANKVLQAAVKK